MKAILLIMIGLSSLGMAVETPRFTKVDGVVTDTKTTLEWQDDYGDSESIKSATWGNAIDYCEGLFLNSKDDWRLPNKKELLSIVDYDRYDPAMDVAFKKITSYYYWSSTTNASYTNFAWGVNFGNGNANYDGKSNDNNVRCVRAGQ